MSLHSKWFENFRNKDESKGPILPEGEKQKPQPPPTYPKAKAPMPPEKEDAAPAAPAPPPPTFERDLAAARAGQERWADKAIHQRLEKVSALYQGILDHTDELTAAVDESHPRAPGDTLTAEVFPLLAACRFLIDNATDILRPKFHPARPLPMWISNVAVEVRPDPYGIVLIIGPSNYPLMLPGIQALQALVAGNAVLMKPGRTGEKVMRVFERLLKEARFDMRLFQLFDESSDTVTALIEEGVDKVVLTGSTNAGKAILNKLADSLTPATMELSGCGSVIVLDDAEPEFVVKALCFGLRFNGAATGVGPHRVFLPRKFGMTFEVKLCKAIAELGALEVDPAIAKRTKKLVDQALKDGATKLTGLIEPGQAFRPVVLTNCTADMAIMNADIFAPVLCLKTVVDADEAVRLTNACPYALGATILGDEKQARTLARRVRTGVVVVNDMIAPTADERAPFGGRGQSGFGTTRGAEGLLGMTTTKTIATRKGKMHPHLESPGGMPASILKDILIADHGTGFMKRWQARKRAIKALRKLQKTGEA
jgi:acyl-CoA reductase-like NAD-dependent aldehyde dehydrogenase